jgi:hypothetical protein
MLSPACRAFDSTLAVWRRLGRVQLRSNTLVGRLKTSGEVPRQQRMTFSVATCRYSAQGRVWRPRSGISYAFAALCGDTHARLVRVHPTVMDNACSLSGEFFRCRPPPIGFQSWIFALLT